MLSSKNKEKIYIKCIESIKSTSESNKLKFISKLLFESFDNWIFCGFYFQENDKLLVSEYSANKIPCSPIEFNGVIPTPFFPLLSASNCLYHKDKLNKESTYGIITDVRFSFLLRTY